MPLYLGEATGARVILYGTGLSQIDDTYAATFTTWDMTPAQEVGDVVFRALSLSFSYDNGYNLGITPILDGVSLTESQFNGAGSSVKGQCQVFLGVRGTRLAATVRCISQTGQIHFLNLQATFSPIRQWP